jgi:TonB family protein
MLCMALVSGRAREVTHVRQYGVSSGGADSTTAHADKNITIVTGIIRERAGGKAMPNVNVFVQGTAQGTQTDEIGHYSMRVPVQSVLTISHVGFLTERIPVGLGGNLDVLMRKGVYKIPLPEITGGYYAKTPPASAPRRFIRSGEGGYTVLEQMPSFVYGGYAGLAMYIRQTAVKTARQSGQTGKVHVGFTVGKDAHITDVYIIQSENVLLNREAMAIIRGIQGWIPGTQCGLPVAVRVSLTINFEDPQPQ